MNAKEIISSGLLELYAAGLTSPEETLLVQQCVQQYPEVAEELNAIEQSIESFAQAQSKSAGDSVKEKIFAQINEESKRSDGGKVISMNEVGRNSSTSWWKYLAAASVVLLIGSSILNFNLYKRNTTLAKDLQTTKESVASLESQQKEMDQYIEAVRNRYSTTVSLSGINAETADAAAKVFWTKNTGEVYVDASLLPAAPKGKQYELWAIIDGKPVNAGIILTTSTGKEYKIQKMKSFGNVQAFAVSIESENITPAETPTEVYVVGKL